MSGSVAYVIVRLDSRDRPIGRWRRAWKIRSSAFIDSIRLNQPQIQGLCGLSKRDQRHFISIWAAFC